MCYLIRENRVAAAEGGGATALTHDRVRPRWIGAVAAALIAGVAMAALVAPSASPPPSAKDSAPAAASASTMVSLPTTAVVEQKSTLAPDDGVPTSASEVRAGMGDCHHGL